MRILFIGDDEIELPVGDQLGKPLENDGAAGASDNVADEKTTHELKPSGNR